MQRGAIGRKAHVAPEWSLELLGVEALHDLVVFAANGHHAGILVVLFDSNPRNNMSAGDIARAVRNLEKAGVSIADSYHELNHWQ